MRFLSCSGDNEPERVDIRRRTICQGSCATQVATNHANDHGESSCDGFGGRSSRRSSPVRIAIGRRSPLTDPPAAAPLRPAPPRESGPDATNGSSPDLLTLWYRRGSIVIARPEPAPMCTSSTSQSRLSGAGPKMPQRMLAAVGSDMTRRLERGPLFGFNLEFERRDIHLDHVDPFHCQGKRARNSSRPFLGRHRT